MPQTKTVSACPLTLYSDTDIEINIPLNPENQTRALVLPLRTWDIKTPPNTLRALFSSSGEVDEFLHWLSIDVADCPWQDDSFIPPPPPTPSPGVLILIYRCSSLLAAPLPPNLTTAHNYAAAPEIYWRRFANRSWNAHEQNAQMVQELESPAGDRWEFAEVRADEEEWHQRRSRAFSLPL